MEKVGDKVTLTAKDMTYEDQCTWSVTSKCGAISFKMNDKNTITSDQATLSVVEYSKTLSVLGGYDQNSDVTHKSDNKLASNQTTVWLDNQSIYPENELGRRNITVAKASTVTAGQEERAAHPLD